MFFGFFDESGLDEKSKSFFVGGYVAHMSVWFDFAGLWRRTLNRFGIEYFHMTDFENRQKQFREWPTDKRLELIGELVSLITSSNLIGFGAGVVREDYEEEVVASGILDRLPFTKEWWQEPYLIGFQQCIVEAAREAADLPASERVSFVFDRQDQFEHRLTAVFRQMAADTAWKNHIRLGEITFESKEGRAGLQAADIICYELRKRLDHRLTEPDRPIRKALQRLVVRQMPVKFIDAEGMRKVLDQVQRKPNP